MKMSFTLVMDKEIDLDKHYISPGGYEFTFPNGKSINFDFIACYRSVNDNNNFLLDCEVDEFDKVAFGYDTEDTLRELFERYDTSEIKIVDFFIYVGEENEPEINALSVKNLIVTFEYTDYQFKDFDL